jgi:hypothetical protein
VAVLRARNLNDSHRAFVQGSKNGADVMAKIASAKGEAGLKVNALGVVQSGDDASKLTRFVKSLNDVSPGLVRAFDAFCAAVYRRPFSEIRAATARDVSETSRATGDDVIQDDNDAEDLADPADPSDPADPADQPDPSDQPEDAPGDTEDDKNIAYDVAPADSDDEAD